MGPYIVGIAAAAHQDATLWLALPTLVFFLFFTYPANIYIYGINDIYDYETDKHNPKKVAYESLVMPDEQKKLFSFIALVQIPFIVYAALYTHTATYIALCVFYFCAGFYSAPPIRAKARPFLDSLFSAGHYIATGVFSFLLISEMTRQPIAWLSVAIASIAGLAWAIAMHAYSAVPDIQADTAAGLETVATKLQKKHTLLFCLALYLLSGILSYAFLGLIGLGLSLIYVALMYKSIKTTDAELFKLYTYFPLVNTLSGIIVFFTVLLGVQHL